MMWYPLIKLSTSSVGAATDAPLLGIDVHCDGPEPAQIWQGLAVLVDAPHSAVVLNDYVIDQVEVAKANNPQ